MLNTSQQLPTFLHSTPYNQSTFLHSKPSNNCLLSYAQLLQVITFFPKPNFFQQSPTFLHNSSQYAHLLPTITYFPVLNSYQQITCVVSVVGVVAAAEADASSGSLEAVGSEGPEGGGAGFGLVTMMTRNFLSSIL